MKFLIEKLFILFSTLVGVSLITFFLIRIIPGDPVLLMLGERGASQEVYDEAKKNLGLDRSLPEQYFIYIKNILKGDFGISIISKRPVIEEFKNRFSATVELSVCAILFAVIFGIPLGIISAIKRNTFWDYSVMSVSLIGYSMPIFWWGLILILIFSVELGLTPVSGRISLMFDVPVITGLILIDSLLSPDGIDAFNSAISHLLLPSVVLGTIPLAIIARMTRSSLLEVLNEEYIRTAKAKGLGQFTVVFKHALKNALIPVVTVVGLMVGTLISGAILTETIFSWPGIGRWLVSSVTSRDYPVIQGGVLLIATIIVLVNIFVDLIYFKINPVMRSQK